jgi:hypothetical protein
MYVFQHLYILVTECILQLQPFLWFHTNAAVFPPVMPFSNYSATYFQFSTNPQKTVKACQCHSCSPEYGCISYRLTSNTAVQGMQKEQDMKFKIMCRVSCGTIITNKPCIISSLVMNKPQTSLFIMFSFRKLDTRYLGNKTLFYSKPMPDA